MATTMAASSTTAPPPSSAGQFDDASDDDNDDNAVSQQQQQQPQPQSSTTTITITSLPSPPSTPYTHEEEQGDYYYSDEEDDDGDDYADLEGLLLGEGSEAMLGGGGGGSRGRNASAAAAARLETHRSVNLSQSVRNDITRSERAAEKRVTHTGRDERATTEQVLDPRTRLILWKLLNKGFLSSIDGCLSTGKEANVYYAAAPTGEEYAIKVFKTSILVFKDRDRYVSGEFRVRPPPLPPSLLPSLLPFLHLQNKKVPPSHDC